jgi:hypothetical protein
VQMQLTQPVGRDESGGASHLATICWCESGKSVIKCHRNFLYELACGHHVSRGIKVLMSPLSTPTRVGTYPAAVGSGRRPTATAVAPTATAVASTPGFCYPPFFSPELTSLPDRFNLPTAIGPVGHDARKLRPRWRGSGGLHLLMMGNPHLLRQPCVFDFRSPSALWHEHPYLFTWQRYNVFARWRCAPLFLQLCLCIASSTVPAKPESSCSESFVH